MMPHLKHSTAEIYQKYTWYFFVACLIQDQVTINVQQWKKHALYRQRICSNMHTKEKKIYNIYIYRYRKQNCMWCAVSRLKSVFPLFNFT